MDPDVGKWTSQNADKQKAQKSYRVEIRPGLILDLFVAFSAVLILFLGWLMVRYIDAGLSGQVVVIGVVVATIIANLFVYQRYQKIAIQFLQSILSFSVVAFFINGGIDNNGWFWLIPYSFLTFFLQGHIKGLRWNIGMAGIICVVTLLHGLGLFGLPYDSQTTFLYLVLYFFMLALAFINSFQIRHELKTVGQEILREHELEKEYEKFKLAVDQVTQQIVITDPDGIIIYANRATEFTTGFPIDEIIGKKAGAKDLWGGQMDKEFYSRLWQRIKSEKKPFVGEIRNRRKNGEIYYCRASISPVLDQQKNILYFVGIEKDITDEKNLEGILARDEAILFNIGDGLIATDKNGKVRVMNRAAEWLLGKPPHSLLGKNLVEEIPAQDENHQLIPATDRLTTKYISGKIPAGQLPPRVKQYFRRGDGTWFPVVTTIAPILIGNTVDGIVAVFHDVSREEAIEKTKTEFISVASHQLQTPLSAIGWLTELLQDNIAGRLTARQKEVVEKIEKSNKRMVEIVNSLLNSSRAELGSFIITPEMTDVVDLIREAVAEAKVNPPHRITIIEDYSPNFPTLMIDPLLFRMVVQNLLSNALRYTPDDGRITVRLTHDHQAMTLEVSDTGIGIPPGSQELIYMKFYRAPNAARLQPQGIGLGMFLVKSIVDAAGGKITFTSVENKGTTFQVLFPLSGMKEKAGIRHLTLSESVTGGQT